MYITTSQLLELGVNRETLEKKIVNGQWKVHESALTSKEPEREILVSSLPRELQIKWAQLNPLSEYPEQIAILLSEAGEHGLTEHEEKIIELLMPLAPAERRAWMEEALRMARIVERYGQIKPKRRRNAIKGTLEFVAGVHELCHETACKEWMILARHPHRGKMLSPHTLDGLHRDYCKHGLLAFLPQIKKKSPMKDDQRRAVISKDAIQWVNNNWRRFSGPRFLYYALKKAAKKHGWKIPSESFIYRLWKEMPEIVKSFHLESKKSYVSKHEPYVPRDYSDLHALQVLCGDHSERDVMVSLPDKTIRRPWLTAWFDLRTGLIWGWHLSLMPSSYTAGLAYADGVQNFGGQPVAPPKSGFYSYVYTDRGRDYRSHSWDGKVIEVHKEAMHLEGGIEWLLADQRVGMLDELNIKHLLARGYNAKEKPIERIHKDISAWERNTFEEYCGRDAKSRPDRWVILYGQHQQFVKGKRDASPFMSFEYYRERLAEFITRYNTSEHERPTLGSIKVIPVDEYKRLYTTRYDIAPETLALLLMKAEKRKIVKNGVQCFQKHWFYYHEALSEFKGRDVEVRYSDGDYKSVWVILPNSRICEASLITPTSLINPNKQTLEVVRRARVREKEIIRDFNLIAQSEMRGETSESRVAQTLENFTHSGESAIGSSHEEPAKVHLWTRFERKKLRAVNSSHEVTADDVAFVKADISIFEVSPASILDEFDD